jgi:hypothetical protein
MHSIIVYSVTYNGDHKQLYIWDDIHFKGVSGGAFLEYNRANYNSLASYLFNMLILTIYLLLSMKLTEPQSFSPTIDIIYWR